MNTAKEKVYMAKLEVVISVPNRRITHWVSSLSPALASKRITVALASSPGGFDEQLVVLSDHRTAFSFASCSRVTGRKEPTPHTAKTSAARP
jgi:hypothetical protein